MTMKDKTCIVGVGHTKYGLRGEFFGRSQVDQLAEALDMALAESGLKRTDINGFSSYSMDANDPSVLSPSLGIPNLNYSSMVFGGGGGGTCGAIANASAAIIAGLADVVICYKVITQPPHARFGASYGRARSADPDSDFTRPFGLLAPGQIMSMIYRRHMHKFGTKTRHLAEVAVAQRYHASRNPKALMRAPMTIEDHENSRIISDPFRLFDYCQENDGGCVIIVTSAERAKTLKQKPVYIMGAVMGGDTAWGHGLTGQNAPEPLYTSAGHAHLAKRLYKLADVTPKDIDVVEFYDHFSGMVIMQLEDYGFCKLGEGGPFVENGGIRFDTGRLPVNTHGGNLSEVYLLGMTHIIEATRQLRGTAANQVKDAEIALVTAGPSNHPTSSMIVRR